MIEFAEVARGVTGLVVIVCVMTTLIVVASRRLHVPAWPAIVIFMVLAAIGLVFVSTVGANVFAVSDAIVYDRDGASIARFLRGEDGFPTMLPGHAAWPILLGAIYFVFGDHQLLGLVINAGFVGLASVFVNRTAVEFAGAVSPKLSVAAILLMPLVLLYGPSLMREALSWFGVSLLGCGAAMMITRRLAGPSILVAGALVSIAIRPTLGLFVTLASLGAVVVIRLLQRRRFLQVAAVVLGSALGTYFLGPSAITVLSFSPAFVEDNRDYLAGAATGFVAPAAPVTGTLGLGITGLLTLPRAVLGPLPSEIGPEPVWLWVIVNTAYWFGLLALVVIRFRGRPEVGAVLLLITSIAMVGIAITLTNYGIVVRMRGMAMFLMLPLVLAPIRPPLLRPTTGEAWDLVMRDRASPVTR
jgi:hypothetical protein